MDPEIIPPAWQQYLSPETLTSWGVAAVKGILILLVGWIIAGWVRGAVKAAMGRANVDEALARFLSNIARYVVIFAVLIAAAGAIGIETTSLTAIFASAGLAVGLALQGSLSNFAAGVMILFFKPFSIGDWVTVDGTTGKVTDIGLFATNMMLPDGTKVVTPNGGITDTTIENHTVLNKRRATVSVGVDYGSDLDEVRKVLTAAAEKVPEILFDDGGFVVFFANFGDSSLDWVVHAWTTAEHFLAIQEKLRIEIYNGLNEAGIGIPFPQVDLHLDGKLDS